MKILAIHNIHRKGSASGDDQVFRDETALLEKNGNQVVRYTVSNDEFDKKSIFGKLLLTFGMLWSFKNYKSIKKIIKKEKPDIIHIHTFFPLLSPSILYAAKRSGVKVVATLHDTRFVCPCATSLRNGNICNLCGDGKYLRMCKYKCFKNSRFQSFLVALIFKYHRIKKSFYKNIDCYICLNENQIKLLTNIGFDSKKIVKKYNFVYDLYNHKDNYVLNSLPKRYVVFYGRIGEEKGIRVLMNIWNEITDIPLVVMGSGPLEAEFNSWAQKHENIYYLGYTEHSKCLSIVGNSEFVIFPSIWYEGCSMVEIETESLGKGLIATDLGFSSEAIEEGKNGFKVKLGDIDGFKNCIQQLWNDSKLIDSIGCNARQDYEQKYMPNYNYVQLMNIYNKTMER